MSQQHTTHSKPAALTPTYHMEGDSGPELCPEGCQRNSGERMVQKPQELGLIPRSAHWLLVRPWTSHFPLCSSVSPAVQWGEQYWLLHEGCGKDSLAAAKVLRDPWMAGAPGRKSVCPQLSDLPWRRSQLPIPSKPSGQ